VLAVLSSIGGILDLPWIHHDNISRFLEPVFANRLFADHADTLNQWVLAGIDAAVALVGIVIAWAIWGATAERPQLEPQFLRRVWYWDGFYDAIIGRPGQAFAQFCNSVIESRVIDGAVNGVAGLVRRSGSAARRVQTGFVRNYALAIGLGLAAIVVFVASRAWWS